MAVSSSHANNISTYSVVESATPLAPGAGDGGVSSLTMSSDDQESLIRVNRTSERTNIAIWPRLNRIGSWEYPAEFVGSSWDETNVTDPTAPSGSYSRLEVTAPSSGMYAWRRVDGWYHYENLPELTTYTYSIYARATGTLIGKTAKAVMEQMFQVGVSFFRSYESGATAALTSGWTRYSVTFTTMETVDLFALTPAFEVTGTPTAGDTLELSAELFEEGVSVGSWFSGASANTNDFHHEWDGAPDISRSTQYVPQFVYGDPVLSAGGGYFWLEDDERGRFEGFLSSANPSSAWTSYTALHGLSQLNVSGVVPGLRYGTLGDYIRSIFAAAGTVALDLEVPAAIDSRQRDFSGFSGNLWTAFNHLLVAEGLEVRATSEGAARILEAREGGLGHHQDISWSTPVTGGTNAAKYVAVNWRKVLPPVFWPELYPVKGEEAQVISVGAGEVIEVELQVNASVISVNQPEVMEWVEADIDYYEGTEGAYSVAGNDGLPVTPSFWTDQGGSLRVELTDQPDIIKVIVRGCDNEDYAPYRIAMTSGNYYNSLRITGVAVQYTHETVRIPTGADPRLIESDEPVVVDNPYISDIGTALRAGSYAAEANSGRSHTLNLESFNVDKQFGEICGTRMVGNGVMFRVDGVTATEGNTSVTGFADSTLGDWESVWGGADLGDLETEWAGYTLGEFWIMPLRRESV